MIGGALEVAKDALQQGGMSISWSMHMEAHLLDGVGDVGPCQCQVLQGADHATVPPWIMQERAVVVGDLGFVSACVLTGLQLAMPARSRTSVAYLDWERKKPVGVRLTSMPRKYCNRPMSLMANADLRRATMCWRSDGVEAESIMLST